MKGSFTNIATAIKTHRERTPWSQVELAAKLGLCGQAISNVERGKANLAPHYILTVAKFLNIEEDVLVSAMVQDFQDAVKREMARHSPKEHCTLSAEGIS